MAINLQKCAGPGTALRHVGSPKLWPALRAPHRFTHQIRSGRRPHSTLPNVDAGPTIQSIPELPASYAKTRSSALANSSSSSPSRLGPTRGPAHSPQYDPSRAPIKPSKAGSFTGSLLSEHIRDALPLFAAQTPHYATIHIHGKPYLVTEGDTLRLPFLMHGVGPGDILRLNRVTSLGSRDWTLCIDDSGMGLMSNAQKAEQAHRSAHESTDIGLQLSNRIVQEPKDAWQLRILNEKTSDSENIAVSHGNRATAYLDERLYTIRAVVLGTESEPLRIKEKKKQRNRHTRTVKSKHRFTILRIKELGVVPDVEVDIGGT